MGKKKSSGIKASDIVIGIDLLLEEEFIEHGLNYRQRQIAHRLFVGESGNQIAKGLYISLSCVRYHIGKIYERTHTHNKEEFMQKMWVGINVSKISWKNRSALRKDVKERKRHIYRVERLEI